MQRHAFITLSIVLVAVSGVLAKKEPAIPNTATNPKQVSLVRVNVTGQGHAPIVTVISRAFFDFGHAPKDQSNWRSHQPDYAAREIHPVTTLHVDQ